MGKKSKKSEEGQEDQLCLFTAQDIHQEDYVDVRPEQVPNALALLWHSFSDRQRPSVPASRLNHLEARLLCCLTEQTHNLPQPWL